MTRAQRDLESGRYLLAGGFVEKAGRDAYMAAFHAALAYIAALTGKEPKTHHGTHTVFAKLVSERQDLPQEYVSLLSRSYDYKDIADYDITRTVSLVDAEGGLQKSAEMVASIERLLMTLAPSSGPEDTGSSPAP